MRPKAQPPPADHRRHHVGTRPTRDIYEIVAYRQDGSPIRVIDRATETLRLGGSHRDVADRCGVNRDVVREWLRRGTACSADVYAGRRTVDDLTRHERKCFDFVQLTAQAEAEGKLYLLGLAEKLAQGGTIVETVTEKVTQDGQVLERSTKRTTLGPDAGMVRWKLAARWPEEFGRRTALEVSGPDGGPVQVEAVPVIDRLLGELDRIAENTAATDALLAGHNGGPPALGPVPDTPPA